MQWLSDGGHSRLAVTLRAQDWGRQWISYLNADVGMADCSRCSYRDRLVEWLDFARPPLRAIHLWAAMAPTLGGEAVLAVSLVSRGDRPREGSVRGFVRGNANKTVYTPSKRSRKGRIVTVSGIRDPQLWTMPFKDGGFGLSSALGGQSVGARAAGATGYD